MTDLIGTQEASAILGVNGKTVCRWVRQGYLLGYHVGAFVNAPLLLSRADVLALAQRRAEAQEKAVLLHFMAEGNGDHGKLRLVSRPVLYCTRCGHEIETPGSLLCVYCQTESRGARYWLRRCLDMDTTPDCMAGRLEAR